MNETHPMTLLFDQLDELYPYPNRVAEVPEILPEFAFFPGGAGLWGVSGGFEWPPIPKGRVMVLGHNFGSTDYYDKCRRIWKGDDQNSATWRSLWKLLATVGIPLEWCLFTNIYFGLRTDGKETGKFPGANNQLFKCQCQALFQESVGLQKPRLILSFGRFNPEFLSEISEELDSWKQCQDKLKLVDQSETGPVVSGVRFTKHPELETVVVALSHPSCRMANTKKRLYNKQSGHDVEIDMIRDALSLSGLV